ncbi:MAG: hypothetical protein JW863_20995 [Chitinispirillaceae bacterium]|nr:hypothetical protein [Chitinispirillaceae bacterium]
MNARSWFHVAVICCAAGLLLLRCTLPSSQDEAGNISQTGNGRVAGILYVSDGATPARNAIVTIRPRASLADTVGLGIGKRLADTATVTTDDSGKFEFDSTLDTGLYVIEANQGDTALGLIDSVHVTDPDSTVVVEDTLKPAGSITGTIYLSEGGDVRKVFILAFGINRFATPNTDGQFSFDSLAEGKYDLRIISSLDDYAVLDTFGVPVVSEEVTDLDTLRIPFTGIPTPENLTVFYDTLTNSVTLSWETADPSLVQGYNVLRREGTSGQYTAVNAAFVPDTFFTDTPENGLEKGVTYQYIIRATDADENEGLNSQDVTVRIAFFVDAGKDTMYQLGDSVILQARVDTATVGAATEYHFDVDGDGTEEFVSETESSFGYVYTDTGTYEAVVSIEGESGSFSDTVEITVVPKDTAGAPSAPQGLSLSYDTLLQIVTLTWNPNAESDVAGYNVYRKHSDSDFVKINAAVVTDTLYRDSTGIQDQTYEYKITAVDNTDNEGEKSMGVSVQVVGAFRLLQTLKIDSLRDDPISFAIGADTSFYVAFRGNNNGFVGVFAKSGRNTLSIGVGSFSQLFDLCLDSKENIYTADPDRNRIIKFNKTGDSLTQWQVQRPIRILVDQEDNLFILHGRNPYQITKFDTAGVVLASDTAVTSINDIGDMVIGINEQVILMDGSTNNLLTFNSTLTDKNYSVFSLTGYLRAIDWEGNYYIKQNEKVFVFSSVGEKIAEWQPAIPFERISIFGNIIFVLGNNGHEAIESYSVPF